MGEPQHCSLCDVCVEATVIMLEVFIGNVICFLSIFILSIKKHRVQMSHIIDCNLPFFFLFMSDSVKEEHFFKSLVLQSLIPIPLLLHINLFCIGPVFQAIEYSTQRSFHCCTVFTFFKIRRKTITVLLQFIVSRFFPKYKFSLKHNSEIILSKTSQLPP